MPSTLVCCSYPAEQVRQWAADGNPMFAPTRELRHLDMVNLPGGHWPMFAQPDALADCLHRIAAR